MSQSGSEEEKKVEIPEEPGKKIFISHVNSYTGRALYQELDNRETVREEFAAHTFCGTLETGQNHIYTMQNPNKPDGVEKIVKMERTRDFRESILDSDVIIYDLMTNKFEEVDYVIKTLKTSKLTKEKTLVLLSSVMTWVNTPPKEKKEGEEEEAEGEGEGEAEEEEEEESEPEEPEAQEGEDDDEEKPAKKKILYFKESDCHQRVPHERFFKMKNLETLAMSAPKTQPMLKVNICCAGIRYGNGEGVLYDHFKNAWLQKPAKLPVIGKGDNLIPTIHNIDLARIVRRIIMENIAKEYIFAVDKTKRPTQKRIVQSISKDIGTGQINNFEAKDIADSIIWKDYLNINLKMKTSDAFKDGEVPEEFEGDPDEEAAKLKFPWHCEKGIVENAKQLNIEFNGARGLNPVKIFVSGPPASGKSYYAQKIEKYYNVPRVHVKELTDAAFKVANAEEEEGVDPTEFEAEIKTRVEELRDAAVAKIEEENADKSQQEDEPEIDRLALPIRIPDDIIYKMLIDRLKENDCRNRGYVLDGYPRNFKDAQNIFLKRTPQYDEEGNLMEVDEPELEEGEEKNWDGYEIDTTISPSSVIVLRQDDNFLINRVKNLPDKEITGTHNNPKDLAKRLKIYRECNESQIAEPSVQQFFKERNTQTFTKDAASSEESLFNGIKIYIERIESPINFQYNDETAEAKRRIMVQQDILNQAEFGRKRMLMEEGIERMLNKQKVEHTKKNLQSIREEQKEQLDQKS